MKSLMKMKKKQKTGRSTNLNFLIYCILGNFYVGLFLRFGTKEDFTNLNFCEKASDQQKPHLCNTQLY